MRTVLGAAVLVISLWHVTWGGAKAGPIVKYDDTTRTPEITVTYSGQFTVLTFGTEGRSVGLKDALAEKAKETTFSFYKLKEPKNADRTEGEDSDLIVFSTVKDSKNFLIFFDSDPISRKIEKDFIDLGSKPEEDKFLDIPLPKVAPEGLKVMVHSDVNSKENPLPEPPTLALLASAALGLLALGFRRKPRTA